MSQRLMRSGVAPMTGPLKITDGSVGSPAVQFNSNGSTGFYKTPNGIGVSVGGTKVAEFASSGVTRMLGELIPWTLLSAPSGWVFPYGQTLSRTTYAALWEVAQDEISNGNTFFNNGDGSTTFGIGDVRGRVVAGKDNMGGTAAGRLTTAVNGSVLGDVGGNQALQSHTHTVTGTTSSDGDHQHRADAILGSTVTTTSTGQYVRGLRDYVGSSDSALTSTNGAHTHTVTGTAAAAGTGASGNVQPTIVANYILYAGA